MLALALAGLAAAASIPNNATNSSTGVVTDADALYRALPLKQLRLITPAEGRVSGTDAVTLVFSRAVIALGSHFHGGGSSSVGGVAPLLWTCSTDGVESGASRARSVMVLRLQTQLH